MSRLPLRVRRAAALIRAGRRPRHPDAVHACCGADADGSETDLRTNAERVWYQMHDARVDRTTDGHGLLSAKSTAQVAALRMEDRLRVPSVERTAATVTSYAGGAYATRLLPWEVKESPRVTRTDLAALIGIVDSAGLHQQMRWAARSLTDLQRLQQLAPDMLREWVQLNNEQPPVDQIPGYVDQVNLHQRQADPTYVAAVHATGKRVSARSATTAGSGSAY